MDVRSGDKMNKRDEKQFTPARNVKDMGLRQQASVSSSSEEVTTRLITHKIAKKNKKKRKMHSTTENDDVKHHNRNKPTANTVSNSEEPTEKTTTTTVKPKKYTEKYIKGLYQTPHLVKEDTMVQDFIKDIKQNSKRFFLEMKNKIEDVRSKNKIDFISRSYDEKFDEFLNETQGQKILTRSGTQKVILNIIDTSNGIMRRLVNYLLQDMQKKGGLRFGTMGVLEGELVNEEKQDYLNACEKFGICRAKDRFSLYAAEFLTEIISCDDSKIKLAIDCLTEIFKEADYSHFGDKKLKKQIAQTMDWIDEIEGKELRPLLTTFKNMLVSKNRPLLVMPDAYGSAMNKSVAFLDLVDAIDENLPATVDTIKEWNESISAVREWVAGLRSDIMDIMKKFSDQFLTKAAKRIRGQMAKKVKQNLKILFKSNTADDEEYEKII